MKKPKGKRTPYNKIGDLSPYQPNWTHLFPAVTAGDADETMEEENDESSTICVLRGVTYMKPFTFSSIKRLPMVPVAIPTLIRVKLELVNRGSAAPNAVVRSCTFVSVTLDFAKDLKRTAALHSFTWPRRTITSGFTRPRMMMSQLNPLRKKRR